MLGRVRGAEAYHFRAKREQLEMFTFSFFFEFKVNVRIWPCLSYMHHVRSTLVAGPFISKAHS